MTRNFVIFYSKFYCELNFIKRYFYFFSLYTLHYLIKYFTEIDILPNIMFMRTANTI